MFDLKKPEKAMEMSQNSSNSSKNSVLTGLSEADLIELRTQIDAALPVKRLKEMSLEEEMVLQYRQVRALQAEVINNDAIEPQKQASVVNACASALDNLVKMQERYHHAERLKQIETHLIDCLNRLPPEMTKEFFEWYEAAEL